MNVNNIIKLLLLLLLFVNADAKLIGSIGFISPSYPDFGRYRPSQDVEDFFEDFMETAYDSYSDAGIAVMNRFNMKRGDIIFKDIKYKDRFLIPSEDNKDVIDDFYSRYKIRGNEFLQQIAKSNAVDTILFSSFNKTKLKNTVFENSQLHETDFTECVLTNSVFDNCDLTRATFGNSNLEKVDFKTAYNFTVDPEFNRIKKAKFSIENISGLLRKYDIIIE